MESVRMRVTDSVTDFSKQISTAILRSRRKAALALAIVCKAEPELRGFNNGKILS
jgi:hypothetical protein